MCRWGPKRIDQLLPLALLGERDLQRVVEPALAVADGPQRDDCRLENVIRGQHRVPEAPAGPFDPPGKPQFLLPAEQRYLAHLHQVDADGIVARAGVADVQRFGAVSSMSFARPAWYRGILLMIYLLYAAEGVALVERRRAAQPRRPTR